jgi:hypothetical protein
VDWIHLAQHRGRGGDTVNTAMNLQESIKYQEFLNKISKYSFHKMEISAI